MDYFTGKALEYEVDDNEDGFDDDDDDNHGDDDDESSGSGSAQDSESDSYVPPRGTAKGRRSGPGGANSNPEECKQQ